MSVEYPSSLKSKKPASGPKKAPAKLNRSTRRVSGYRPKARNALYRLVAEFRRRHPKATAAEVWRHLIAVAATGAHPVVIAGDAKTLAYRPDAKKIATRAIRFDSFASRLSRLGALDFF